MAKIKNKDIAAALGLSTAAVSIALSGKPGVSDETRRKIFDYIKEQGGNLPSAGNLPAMPAASESLLLCIYKKHGSIIIEKPFFSGLLEAIQIEAAENGFTLNIYHLDSSQDDLPAKIKALDQMEVSGIILLATEMLDEDLQPFLTLRTPLVLMDSYFDYYHLDSVSIDDENAVFNSYVYAHNMGHRSVGYLASAVTINNFIHRFDGYMKARRTFGDKEDPVVFYLPTSIDQAQKEFSRQLDNLPKNFKMPTCFIADLDYIAIGAMLALKEHGYRIPEDVSMIGFDDVDSSLVCDPQLTTVHLHQRVIGREAVRLLLTKVRPGHETAVRTLIGCELVERKSVKKLL